MKRDLSRKADATMVLVLGYVRGVRAGRGTFHDTRFINSDLESNVANLNVRFRGEGDAAEEQEQLSRRAGHCREDRRLFVVHGAVLCLCVMFVI